MELAQWLGTVGVSAVTTGALMWAGAKVVASKWLDARFTTRLAALKLEGDKQLEAAKQEGQRQLEATKHEYVSYIERVKFERSNLLDRSVKLNQREFEIIPAIWNAVTEAHYSLLRLISRWQEPTNLHYIGDAQFESFLTESGLRDWEKDELRGKSGKRGLRAAL
ncbi:hypothetical protein C8J25_107285 [Sphingomonas faeni]|uniref:Uncharacterized protein n=1 Tax=Sphingomonas faeni TaxID=185950 RepID=A0A2T5U2B4_9SPHN|nr:hypothetical protein [Sphingomonas faeni]PTW45600.1 hypothetical protein C8J25_107285 [Sphingomonas faeni]